MSSNAWIVLAPYRWTRGIAQRADGVVSRSLSCDAVWLYPNSVLDPPDLNIATLMHGISLYESAEASETPAVEQPPASNEAPQGQSAQETVTKAPGARIGSVGFHREYRSPQHGETYPAGTHATLNLRTAIFDQLWDRAATCADVRVSIRVEGLIVANEFSPEPSEYTWPCESDEKRPKWLPVTEISVFIVDAPTRDPAAIRRTNLLDRRHSDDRGSLEAIAKSSAENLLKDFPPEHQVRLIGKEIIRQALSASLRLGDDEWALRSKIKSGLDLLYSIETALKQTRTTDIADRWLWTHANARSGFREGFASKWFRDINRGELAHAARQYLMLDWLRFDLIEWILTDALLLAEVQAFGEEVKMAGDHTFLKRRYEDAKGSLTKLQSRATRISIAVLAVLLIIVAGVGFATYLWAESREWDLPSKLAMAAYSALTVLWLTVGLPFPETRRERAARRRTELFAEMHSAYETLNGGAISPHAVRLRMLETARQGAVWDQSAYAILDVAAGRSLPVWTFPNL